MPSFEQDYSFGGDRCLLALTMTYAPTKLSLVILTTSLLDLPRADRREVFNSTACKILGVDQV
ncbi:hypothetical protein SAMN05421772_10388 [Paracoccus saliphilus]|uniref:Uncharacterized protein n=1 Tax=Paracoccus saliphilus TaxID=405559 RepID=A0AA46A4V0_9RHOB|nr:hypothetical protein SAMN05421772_10388 [Paracoccus saliphilus]